MDSERRFLVAFHQAPGMTMRRLMLLQAHFGSFERAWAERSERLGTILAFKAEQLSHFQHLHAQLDPLDVLAWLEKKALHAVSWFEPSYPASLRQLTDPPPLLYVRGTLPEFGCALAMVGAREATPYGLGHAQRFARQLSACGVVVVSGVAAGIDAAAHRGALQGDGGATVGVLGCGHDHVFPRGHARLYQAIARQGALISEFPPATPPGKWTFPQRNRIIAGLTAGTIVIEAGLQSGSLITCDFALEQGKTVFAMPGPIDSAASAGPHKLLLEGARLLTSVQDIFDEMGWNSLKQVTDPHDTLDNPIQAGIVKALTANALSVEELLIQTKLSLSQLSVHLLKLVLSGHIRELPGARYARN